MVKTRSGKKKEKDRDPPEPFGGVTETEAIKWLKKLAVDLSATLKQYSKELDSNLRAHFRAHRTSSSVGVVTRKRKLSEVLEESPQVPKHDSKKKLKIEDSEASPEVPKHASKKLKIEEPSAVRGSRKKSPVSGKGKGKAIKTDSSESDDDD